jgi:RNA-directed DNA polymerase
VIGFENEIDARACLDALKERLEEFGLKLHPDKTRLLEFGRAASDRRAREGREPCETFEFLGFTHICGKTRKNKRFVLWRRTRISRTLAAIKVQLRQRRHYRVGQTGRWLASVIRGWMGYHAVPDNFSRLDEFVTEVTKLWLHQLRRRSQKGRAAWPWNRLNRLVDRYLPQPKILHPYPQDRFRARLAAGAV